MRCLSVRQPWAYAIFELGKDIENRTWTTRHRGLMLIHASKSQPSAVKIAELENIVLANELTTQSLKHTENAHRFLKTSATNTYTLGSIIGSVELVDIVQNSKSQWACENQHHWILQNPVLFSEPVYASGRQNLWRPDAATQKKIDRQLGKI